MVNKTNNKRGRPRISIDLGQLQKLRMLQCTDMELAAFFNVSVDTIERRKQNDSAFFAVYSKGAGEGKIALRRRQFQLAEKNAQMAIFLGKNWIEQSDRIEHTGRDAGPIRFVIGEDNQT